MSRLDRENFLELATVNDIEERDIISNHWDTFKIKRPTKFYTIRYDDIQRPDLLSLRLYKKVDYWWILLKVNGIDDPWNDLLVGNVIAVPDVLDIEDWYLTVK